jgi:hypothetical protein
VVVEAFADLHEARYYRVGRALSLAQQLRQLGDIRCYPPRLVALFTAPAPP